MILKAKERIFVSSEQTVQQMLGGGTGLADHYWTVWFQPSDNGLMFTL